jgi:hypothetical protein
MDHVNTRHHLEQLTRHVERASGAARSHADLSRVGPGVSDELGNRVGWHRWIDHHDYGVLADARNRRDVPD